jgi:hypothetical protein
MQQLLHFTLRGTFYYASCEVFATALVQLPVLIPVAANKAE